MHPGPAQYPTISQARDVDITMLEPTYKNDMAADAPRIMLIVLSRLLTIAKNVKLKCATVPFWIVSEDHTTDRRIVVTVSNTNNFENSVCFWNTALADDSKVAKEDDNGRAACSVPECTTDSIAVSNEDAAEQSCAP